MSLEQDLRGALKRREPAAGFDGRVLSKIASGATAQIPNRRRSWAMGLSWAMAASVLLAAGATYYMDNQRRDEHAARAARDVVLALQITSETLSEAQAKVEEMTRHEPKNAY